MFPDDIPVALALLSLRGPGSRGIIRLLCRYPSPPAILQLGPPDLEACGVGPDTAALLRRLDRGLPAETCRQRDWLLSHGVHACSCHDPEYPEALRSIGSPPPLLFLHGSVSALAKPCVAIVGSRKPTPGGRELAHEIAAALAGYGLASVSGLAIGIDAAAHAGTLDGGGATIAVLGTGIDIIYPRRHADLARRIRAEGGLLASEFVPGIPPDPANFPRRNRIVSGLALGVLVVEAALPSGSLLTAQHAADQGREVMAVPGPVRSTVSRGCHELLRNGAALVETAEDVLRALGDRFSPRPGPAKAAPAPVVAAEGAIERQIYAATGFEPTSADLLMQRTGLEPAAVASALALLELRGLLERVGGGFARTR